MNEGSIETAALDPDLAAVLAEGRLADLPAWHELGVAEARRVEDEVFSAGGGPPVARVEDRQIDGPGGDLPLRLYWPEPVAGRSQADALPVVVFAHGGGWVFGTLDSADDICRSLSARLGAVVVAVDYRLAPEHPFPAAVEDVAAAVEWVHEATASQGVAPDRLLVAGTSAGGGLAAAVALRSRDTRLPIAGQVLCYPMLDDDFERASYREHAAAPLLSRADVAWFWEQYLPDGVVTEETPLAAPLRAESLAALPPAVVVTAGHDVLRSEGRAYADRLAAAGVETRDLHYPSLAHGFLSLTDEVGAAEIAMAEVAGAARRLLRTVFG